MEILGLEFLNSEWHDWRGSGRSEDRLDKPEWVHEFLAEWQLPVAEPLSPASRAALGELRTIIRRMVEALAAGGRPLHDDVAALNGYLQAQPLTRRLDHADEAFRLELIPPRHDWTWAMAEIAASFAHLLVERETARIKICENRDCRWVFWDESRNRARRWCDDTMCGNLMKVRRFRARQKEGGKA